MRKAKLGAQKYVGSRSRTCASPSAETVHEATKPSEVIGSSSSGSRTVPNALFTSSLTAGRFEAAPSLVAPLLSPGTAAPLARSRLLVRSPRGALRRRLPSSLVPRSSVQASPRPSVRSRPRDQLSVVRRGRGALTCVEPELGRNVDVVELGRVQAEDLLLRRGVDPGVVGELVTRVVPVDEALDLPLGLPDPVVAAEGHLVLADPEHQLADDLGEELRPGVHQPADDHR